MLRFLRIRRLAVIDSVEVEFGPGLNVLTGETGAGKSILVQAVGLLLGGRATADMVRTGEDAATVEAVFETGGEELIVRREITAQGRSRAFLDGALVTAAALRERTAALMEIHGQHEHQTLLDPAAHLAVLDSFGALEDDVAAVAEAFSSFSRLSADLDALTRRATDADARHDFAVFQLDEIDRARLSPGEDEALAAERQVLANAERLERLCRESRAALYESDHAALASLGTVWRKVTELAAIDPQFVPFLEQRAAIKAQLEDLADTLRGYLDTLDAPPGRLQQVEDRLAVIERLKRKHGPTLADVLATGERLRTEVTAFGNSQERIAALKSEREQARTRYTIAASALTAGRRRAATRLAEQVEKRLRSLAMEKARFEVRFDDSALEPLVSARGSDQIEFFIAPNPGEEPRPLARTASGGELSRLMLAIKTLTAKAPREETGEPAGMVFDEIDAGIGGAVADVVGAELRALAANSQVLCITHLPQVAAYATMHFRISKQVQGGRTVTSVTPLNADARVEELARMIGGATITASIRQSARELVASRTTEAKGERLSKGESETGESPTSTLRKRR